MGNIREYTRRVEKITPSDIGFNAMETAARRLAQFGTQMAAEAREGGRINAETIKLQGAGQSDLLKQANKLADEEMGWFEGAKASGGKGGKPGSGLLNIRPAGGGGGVGGHPAATWADTARGISDLATRNVSHPGGKLVEGVSGNPLYTTGEYNSTPTAGGSYSQQNPGGLSDTLTQQQIDQGLKLGERSFITNFNKGVSADDPGRMVSASTPDITGQLGNGPHVYDPSIATSWAPAGEGEWSSDGGTWQGLVGMATRGLNATLGQGGDQAPAAIVPADMTGGL